jgi:hypothetical protein
MALKIEPPEPDLPNILKHLGHSRPLWRLAAWGSAATIALASLAITTQTESGSERLQLTFVPDKQPVRLADVTPPKAETDAETRALEAQVRALAADRDRLAARIALLERNLDDMTGSIKRQAAQEAAAPAAKPPIPSTPATTQQQAAPANAPPPAKPDVPMIAPLAMPAATGNNVSWPDTSLVQAATVATEPIPLPPTRMASAPASEPATEPPRKPEIGVDLGGAPSIEVLNLRWLAVKANYGPLLTGLHPLAARVQRPGATDLRLLVGPLPNAAAAAQLCARFAAARVTCRPAKFDGEQIALR